MVTPEVCFRVNETFRPPGAEAPSQSPRCPPQGPKRSTALDQTKAKSPAPSEEVEVRLSSETSWVTPPALLASAS